MVLGNEKWLCIEGVRKPNLVLQDLIENTVRNLGNLKIRHDS